MVPMVLGNTSNNHHSVQEGDAFPSKQHRCLSLKWIVNQNQLCQLKSHASSHNRLWSRLAERAENFTTASPLLTPLYYLYLILACLSTPFCWTPRSHCAGGKYSQVPFQLLRILHCKSRLVLGQDSASGTLEVERVDESVQWFALLLRLRQIHCKEELRIYIQHWDSKGSRTEVRKLHWTPGREVLTLYVNMTDLLSVMVRNYRFMNMHLVYINVVMPTTLRNRL